MGGIVMAGLHRKLQLLFMLMGAFFFGGFLWDLYSGRSTVMSELGAWIKILCLWVKDVL